MSAGAFALIRVPRGGARPSESDFRAALLRDHERLHQAPPAAPADLETAGPYPIVVDGVELDEYVAWER